MTFCSLEPKGSLNLWMLNSNSIWSGDSGLGFNPGDINGREMRKSWGVVCFYYQLVARLNWSPRNLGGTNQDTCAKGNKLQCSKGIGHCMTFTHALYSTLLHVSWSLQHDKEGTTHPAVAPPQHRLARIRMAWSFLWCSECWSLPETKYRIGLGDSNSFFL